MRLETALLASLSLLLSAAADAEGSFVALCYHDVVSQRSSDPRAVEEVAFLQQIEFLRSQKASFVSVDEILAAQASGAPLPPNAVLLTFDDGCQSFHRKVLPVLRLYHIPAVLSVVTSWSEEMSGTDCEGGVMSWEEIVEVARSGLVEVGSHSHDLHGSIPINPQGSTAAAASSHRYEAASGRYETEAQYRGRLARDLGLSSQVLRTRLGRAPRVLAWPYGEYTLTAREEARRAGFQVMLTTADEPNHGVAQLSALETVPRRMVLDHPSLKEFALSYWAGGPAALPPRPTYARRVVHADLDLLYDQDPQSLRRNVDRFIDRMVALKPSEVYLQAFCDDSGTGNVSSVYFPNRVLPMKADLFSFVARALQNHDIRVYAWMPSLSLVLPDTALTESLRVRELGHGTPRPSRMPYRRLSPFSEVARQKAATLFEDLAIAVPLYGILFQDDAYLDDHEDFHPSAQAALRQLGIDPGRALSQEQRRRWTARKTQVLIEWTDAMMAAVRRHRPLALAVRTLYAPVLLEPESEEWFAQSYTESLRAYDQVVVMAYPRMEGIEEAEPWLQRLVAVARASDHGLEKTVFKVQSVDWKAKGACVPAATLAGWLRTLVGEGARNLAYYPDNLFADCPSRAVVRDFVSTEQFPFAPGLGTEPPVKQ